MRFWSCSFPLIAVYPVSGISLDEGCHFVSARFARGVSSCDAGHCTGIVRLQDGRYGLGATSARGDAVPCPVAVLDTEEFLGQVTTSKQRGLKRLRTDSASDELNDLLNGELLPLLRHFSLTGNISLTKAKRIFSQVDMFCVTKARYNWREWRFRSLPGAGAAVEETMRLAASAVRYWLWKPLREDLAIAAVMDFYFDFAALTFRHAVDDGALYLFGGIVTLYFSPIHRYLGPREYIRTTIAPIGLPKDTTSGLIAVRALHNDPASARSVMPLTRLFMSSRLNSNTSSDAIIVHSMEERCSGLAAWLFAFLSPEGVPDPLKLKIGSSWLDFCRGRASRADLHSARRALLISVNAELVIEPPAGQVLSWLASLSDARKGRRLPEKNETETRAFATMVLNEVLHSDLFEQSDTGLSFREPVWKNAFIVGRGIGIAALGGADLSPVPFSSELMLLIHPRLRNCFASMSDSSAAVAVSGISSSWEGAAALNGLTAGVADAFGPGGAEIITESDWIFH